MIVCINGSWKIPIAYYFVKGTSANDKTNLITQCLEAVHKTGLRIVSVTCDGTSTNMCVLQHLGCNFNDVDSLQTSFSHPSTNAKIVAFTDPCHMLKLVRNTFGDSKHLLDGDGQFIK